MKYVAYIVCFITSLNQLLYHVSSIIATPNSFILTQPDNSVSVCFLHGTPKHHYITDDEGYLVMYETIDDEKWLMYAVEEEVEDDSNAQVRRKKSTASSTKIITSSGIRVGKIDGEEKKKMLMPNLKPGFSDEEDSRHSHLRSLYVPSPDNYLNFGSLPNLVILLRFQDDIDKILPTKDEYEILFNQRGQPFHSSAPTGSIHYYYHQNSYGKLEVDSFIYDWITLPNTASYYADGKSGMGGGFLFEDPPMYEMLRFALNHIENDPEFSFKQFDLNNDLDIDAITFIHSGYGAESGGDNMDDRIWSHRSSIPTWTSAAEDVRVRDYHISSGLWGISGSEIARIGVIAHELGHFLGLPDLYDTDESNGKGIGKFGLMSNSWGFDGSQLYPSYMSAWCKIKLGWVQPKYIATDGIYEIKKSSTTADIFKINIGFPTSAEYLLVENRQKTNYDGLLPQGGLFIYHIDENAGHNGEGFPGQPNWPGNGNHYRVALLQADGNYDLERGVNSGDGGDVFHGQGVNELVSNFGKTSHKYPNTDPYPHEDGSDVSLSNFHISQISDSADTMTFQLSIVNHGKLYDGAGFCLSPTKVTNPLNPDYNVINTGRGIGCSAYGSNWEQCLLLCYPKCDPGYGRFGCNLCIKGWFRWRGRGVGKIPRCNHDEFNSRGKCHKNCKSGYYRYRGTCKAPLVFPECPVQLPYTDRCQHQNYCSNDCSKINHQSSGNVNNNLSGAPLCGNL